MEQMPEEQPKEGGSPLGLEGKAGLGHVGRNGSLSRCILSPLSSFSSIYRRGKLELCTGKPFVFPSVVFSCA